MNMYATFCLVLRLGTLSELPLRVAWVLALLSKLDGFKFGHSTVVLA